MPVKQIEKNLTRLTTDSKEPIEQLRRIKLRNKLESQRKYLKNRPTKAQRKAWRNPPRSGLPRLRYPGPGG